MTFLQMPEAERKRVVEGLVSRFGEASRAFFAGRVFFACGNHAWLATKECVEFASLPVNVQQPGLLALTDVKNAKPSRELESLLTGL